MPLIQTLFLLVACMPVPWPEPLLHGPKWLVPAATSVICGLALLRAWRAARRALRRLDEPFRQSEALVAFHQSRSRQPAVNAAAFVVAVSALGWGWFVQSTLVFGQDATLLPFAEVVVLAPYLLTTVLSWSADFPVERRVNEYCGRPTIKRPAYLLFQFRQKLALALIPVALVVTEQSVCRVLPEFVAAPGFRAAGIGIALVLMAASPWGLRLLLGMRPLAAGPLRERLIQTARRVGLRFSDLLVWHTRGTVGNAMVAGVLPWPRYVMFTDRLLGELSADELDAVLGHEVGHIRHRHLLLYLAFLTLSLSALSGAVSFAARMAPADSWLFTALERLGDWQTLIALAAVAAYVIVAFGFLSRRCEREADLFGCRAVSCGQFDCTGHAPGWDNQQKHDAAPCPTGVDVFTTALERVAVINGISRSKPGWLASWQHSTIAARVEFLNRLRTDPDLDRRFRRRLWWTKAALLSAVAALVVVFVATGDLPSVWPMW